MESKLFGFVWRRIFGFFVAVVGFCFSLVAVNAYAVTIDGLTYTTSSISSSNAFDIRGKINGGNSYDFKTTYSYGGYSIDFEVDGSNYSMRKVANDTTITNKGVKLTLTYEVVENGVDVVLSIENPESNGDHKWKLAMTADIQLGSNDYAAIYKKGHEGLVITQDDPKKSSDYGAKIFIDFSPSVNTSWIGFYRYRSSYKYNESDKNSYTVTDDTDTGAAWSWNGELKGGEDTTLTTSYSLVETNKTKVGFYDLDGNFLEEKEVLVGGAVTLPTLSDPEEGFLHLWCKGDKESADCYNGGTAVIVEDEDMNFYEVYKEDPDYVKTSTIIFYGTDGNVLEEKEVAVGESTTLPTLSDPEEGFLHLWCKGDKESADCYNGGTAVIVEDEDMNFYEVYKEDPDYVKTSTIIFYGTDGNVLEEKEVAVGESTTLPTLSDPEEGFLHLWCKGDKESADCYNGGTAVIVEDEDMNFYEVYKEDPDYVKTSTIIFYGTDGNVLEEKEVAVGESTTLPTLSDPEEGFLHLWCKGDKESADCYNGGTAVIVEDEDMNFYEVYKEDPDYVKTSTIIFYGTDGNVLEEKEVAVGESTTLPTLSDPEEGFLHLWCKGDKESADCYNGGTAVIVEDEDMNFYEVYKEDPDYVKTSTIIFYGTDGNVLEEKEVAVGESTTLPTLSDPEEGFLHLWCKGDKESADCYNGGTAVIVEDEDMNFYEVYKEDPDYVKTSTIIFYGTDGNVLEEKEVAVGESTTLPTLSDPEEGFLHLWCKGDKESADCYNGGTAVIVEDEDMNFYEVYKEDPDYVKTSTIIFYGTDGNVLEEKEVAVGESTTLPTLSDPEEGFLHLWCKGDKESADCYNGGTAVIVEDEDMNFYEVYKEDPDYVKTNEEPIINAINEVVSPQNMSRYVAYVVLDDDLPVPSGYVDDRTDDLNEGDLEKIKPLGVERNTNNKGIMMVLESIWPYLLMLFSIFIFFIILLFKRRKDDDEEEEIKK